MSVSRTKKRKMGGGYFGSLIKNAMVPFTLFGMQNKFNRKSYKGKKKNRKPSRRRWTKRFKRK